MPHKEAVVKYIDKLDDSAKQIKAVNTIHNKDGKLVGYNTDIYGFITSLIDEGRFEPRNKNVFILGAGGAAHAIVLSLAKEKVESIIVSDILLARAKKMVAQIKLYFPKLAIKYIAYDGKQIKEVIRNSELFINATPIGMKLGDCCPIDRSFLHDKLFVYDVVYNRDTELMKTSRDLGLRCMNGADMLVYQGAKAFEIWTNKKPVVELMKKTLLKKIGK